MLTSDSDSQEGDRYAGEELGEHCAPALVRLLSKYKLTPRSQRLSISHKMTESYP